MAAKSKTETPAPTMADIIRNRAYQMWGVEEGAAAKPPAKPPAKRPVKKAAKKPAKAKKPAARKK
ncbi:MAG: hypothetical protein HN403_08790 [Rhodospirillales bacterium]|jgi:hypothetical protein|nr:hypothetical protein [Rhodospirillales bacterium]